MRSRILAGFLAVAMSAISFAPALAAGGTNGNLNGTVIDASSKAPIAGASVVARSGSGTYSSTTDARGFFSILQMSVDSYTVTVTASGHDTVNLQNVIVFGDETDSVGTVAMNPANLKTIAKVTSRAQNGAFQPTQTTDTYSVSGQRVQQALGNQYSTNEAQLIASAPGVIQTYDMGNAGISIRGSLNVELGYQYDEVPFSAPFFNENASQGFINGINGGTGGGLQIVSGAGDATQGNVGGGIINTIVPRGTYPAYANADFEVGGPYFSHTINANWGTGTANGRFSNYMSFSGSSSVPVIAGAGQPGSIEPPVGIASANQLSFGPGGVSNNYFGQSLEHHSDFVDNMVFRFGKNNNQSLQILGRVASLQTYLGYGGLNGLQFFNSPGTGYLTFSGFFNGNAFDGTSCAANNPFCEDNNSDAYLQSLMARLPYQPSAPYGQITQAENNNANPLHFLKFAYTNSLSPTTFLSLSAYNWGLLEGGSSYYNFNSNGYGSGWGLIGGSRAGVIGQITHQLNDNNTMTLEVKAENAHPYWDAQQPGSSQLTILGPIFACAALGASCNYMGSAGLPNNAFSPSASPNASDWNVPNGTGGACPSGPSGCYIFNALSAAGKIAPCATTAACEAEMPAIPNFGINYHNTDQLQYGIGLRDQWQVNDKLNIDWGARMDTEDNKFGPTPFASANDTPSDVAPSKLPSDFLTPRDFEPRFAFSYRLTRNDSIRFSYARSVQFFFGQTLGTPFNVSGISPLLLDIPSKSVANYDGLNPNGYFDCGSGTHGPGTGYAVNPTYGPIGANNGAPAYFFQCQNYAASVAWLYDQNNDAPDLGGYGPPTYSNFDVAWSHLFTKGFLRGWSSRVTGYTRRGFNVEQNVLLTNGAPNPLTGQSSASVFVTTASGNEKTAGIEGQLTTPDIQPGQSGLSGFVTFDYINELLNTPPVAGGAALPLLPQQLLQTGQLFKAGFVPPVSAVIGATYHFKNGVTITPTMFLNNGYPFGNGRAAIGYVNGQLMFTPQDNYGATNTPFTGLAGPGNAYNASYYVDPQVPGSILNPNIAGSRGYDEPALAGEKNSPAQFFLNLDAEVPLSKQVTVGFQVFNVLDYKYNVPADNTFYQPVGYGVAGPQTGTLASTAEGLLGAGDPAPEFGSQGPYFNGYNQGMSWNVYFRTRL